MSKEEIKSSPMSTASCYHSGLHLCIFSVSDARGNRRWVFSLLCVLKIRSIMLSAALLIWSRPWMINIQWSSTSPRYVCVILLIVTPEEPTFPNFPLMPGVVIGSLWWSRNELTRLTIGEMLLLNWEISDVRTYNAVVCLSSDRVSTSNSRSPIASW